MLTVPGLAVRNLRHRRVRTMFLAALVLILSAALFTSRVLTESMKTCIDKTVDRIGADVIVAPGEYESDLSDSLFSGGLCSFYFEKSLMDQVKKTDGIDKISPQLYIASLDAACCSVPVQIVAFEPESDFIVQPWMSGSNVSELKKGQTVVGSRITAKAGDKISFFGQEYEVAGKLEETGTSYDNCAFMNFETAYTLFDSFQIKYVTDLTEPQKYVSLLTIRTKDGADPKEVANTINTKMRDSGLKAYTAKAMSGKVSDTLEQMRSYSALLIGLLFLMAVLALICIFNITVNERLKEFGVLLSIGARKSQIFQMLLLEAGMIGVLGGFLGVVFSGGGILLFKDVIMESMNMPYLNVNVSQYVILALQSLGLAVGVSLLGIMIVKTENLSREFVRGKNQFYAVDHVNLEVEEKELVAIMGQSGSGKSTLFHMLTGILKPTEGKITVLDHEIEKMNDRQLSVLRGGDLGYIMQGQNLLQNLTVMENILLPLSLGKNRKPDKERITYLTELLGIQNMLSEYPANLSGGEQRRVAIARTFAQNPKLVVADEPTSSLDMENSEIIMKYFQKMAKEGTTILVSTHDREFANYADRCLWMKKGKLEKRELE